MEVSIQKNKSRFSIKSKYNADLVNAIRKYDRKFWNQETLEWSLPVEVFDSFLKECEQLGFKVNVKEDKPLAVITNNDDNIELKFAQFTNQYDQFRNIENAIYDRENKKLVIPKSKLDNVIQLLKENNIEHVIKEKETPKEENKPRTSKRQAVNRKLASGEE